MKHLLLLGFVLLTTTAIQAQWWGNNRIKGNGNIITQTREVGTFDRVAVGGFFDVELVDGKEGSLTIEGESNLLEYIVTEVSNGKLIIKTKNNISIRTNKKLKVTVPFADIDGVSLGGSGDVYSTVPIKASHFKTSLSGSGDITLNVEAKSVKASVSGSGDIVIKGSTEDVALSVGGSGDINARQLQARNADVRVSGSGDIDLVCDGGEIKARVSGSGDISYFGNASREDVKVSGSGSIKNKG